MKIKILLALVFIVACSERGNKQEVAASSESYSISNDAAVEVQGTEIPPSTQQPTANHTERKLIRKGSVSFETDDLTETKQRISEGVKKYNGYIANENEYKSSNRMSHSITVRIPSKYFDHFLADISKNVEKFDNKNISVNDVTEEFLDVQARLKVKKALEERYSELLKKAKSVKEILEVERELTNVRADIESMEGRLKYLQNQVSFSTLTLDFYKVEIVRATEDNFWRRLAQAFNNGISNIKWFFIGLINIWPFIIVLIVTYFIIKKRIKK